MMIRNKEKGYKKGQINVPNEIDLGSCYSKYYTNFVHKVLSSNKQNNLLQLVYFTVGYGLG